MTKMKNCTVSGSEIAASAKVCPKCGAKNPKPIYLRGWFIALIVVLCIITFGKISAASNDFKIQIQTDYGIVTLTASELSEIAKNDANQFNEYYGKTATFTAEVKEVRSNIQLSNINTYYTSLLGFNHSIFAGFDKSTNYNVGEKIKITGKISHSVYDDVYIDVSSASLI